MIVVQIDYMMKRRVASIKDRLIRETEIESSTPPPFGGLMALRKCSSR